MRSLLRKCPFVISVRIAADSFTEEVYFGKGTLNLVHSDYRLRKYSQGCGRRFEE